MGITLDRQKLKKVLDRVARYETQLSYAARTIPNIRSYPDGEEEQSLADYLRALNVEQNPNIFPLDLPTPYASHCNEIPNDEWDKWEEVAQSYFLCSLGDIREGRYLHFNMKCSNNLGLIVTVDNSDVPTYELPGIGSVEQTEWATSKHLMYDVMFKPTKKPPTKKEKPAKKKSKAICSRHHLTHTHVSCPHSSLISSSGVKRLQDCLGMRQHYYQYKTNKHQDHTGTHLFCRQPMRIWGEIEQYATELMVFALQRKKISDKTLRKTFKLGYDIKTCVQYLWKAYKILLEDYSKEEEKARFHVNRHCIAIEGVDDEAVKEHAKGMNVIHFEGEQKLCLGPIDGSHLLEDDPKAPLESETLSIFTRYVHAPPDQKYPPDSKMDCEEDNVVFVWDPEEQTELIEEFKNIRFDELSQDSMQLVRKYCVAIYSVGVNNKALMKRQDDRVDDAAEALGFLKKAVTYAAKIQNCYSCPPLGKDEVVFTEIFFPYTRAEEIEMDEDRSGPESSGT